MLTHNITIASAGFLAVLVVLFLRLLKRRAIDTGDLASLGAAFLTGTNIPISLFLCCYPFDPDPASIQTKLHGFEKYIGLAGLSLFVLSAISLWSLCKPAEAKAEMPAATKVPLPQIEPRIPAPNSGVATDG